MSDEPTIAAVFATMNRAETAVSCVRALAVQTLPPSLVVVADNASTDDTARQLTNLTGLPFKLIVHLMSENRGNAGGVEEAMELAFARHADAVWILDDDSFPRPAALAAILADSWTPHVVRHALQIDPLTGQFTWPMWVRSESNWKLVFHPDELPSGKLVQSRSSWTGALIPRETRNQVGPVNGELFIRGEDEEYPLRIVKSDIPFEAVTGAIMDHPGPKDLVHWNLFGKNFFFERGLADWKLYYKVRNMVWLARRYRGGFQAILLAVIYAVGGTCIDGPKRLSLIWQAASDGWTGRLGRWRHHC